METFDEELTTQLKKMMIDHENEKTNYYEWWKGQNDFEHMKRIFMVNYLESELHESRGYGQKEYLEWVLKLIDKKEKHEEERKAAKKKKNLSLWRGEEITGPIYDDDERPTYY